MFGRVRRLRTRVRELLAIPVDFTARAAAQMALLEVGKSATIENPRQALSFFYDCLKLLTFSVVFKTPPLKLDCLWNLNLPNCSLPGAMRVATTRCDYRELFSAKRNLPSLLTEALSADREGNSRR